MTTENIKKLKYRFFREFLPERLYVRYQIVSPYYTQAPTKGRLVELVNEEKAKGRKIKIGEVWWSMPTIRIDELVAIEEVIAMLFSGNTKDRFQNGLEYFNLSKNDAISRGNDFYYRKSGYCLKGQKPIQVGGKNRLEALLKLCLHKDIKDFIKKDIREIFNNNGVWWV